jgi:hypothetical protein
MSGIVWLASYPKSGNTWLRVLLTNYLRNGDQPADINDLDIYDYATSRVMLDEWIGVESSDLRPEEIERYRPIVYRQLAATCSAPLFMKVHDAYTYNADSCPLFPAEATAGVIYVMRNPLDVAVSFAHHENVSLDTIIRRMRSDGCALCSEAGRLFDHVAARLLSWSRHVTSWVDEGGLDVQIVRYEDLAATPTSTFAGIIRFLGLAEDDERVHRAVDFSAFERLQGQECAHGFTERQTTSPSFFREGRVGSWRECLTATQVQRIIDDHRQVMRRFGYLTEADEILY